jgi:Protein-tyrosine phosphatase
MFRWAIRHQLARGRRPGIEGKRGSQVAKSVVDNWIKEAKALGLRSVIVLLDERQLRFYEKLRMDLVSYYRRKGLNVVHIDAPNMRRPPLSDQHLKEVLNAYQRLEKPVLVHCSAGIGRTGAAIRYLKNRLEPRRIESFQISTEALFMNIQPVARFNPFSDIQIAR